MVTKFEQAMMKLAVVGHNPNTLIDCSEVIPVPPPIPAANARSVFPAGFSNADIEQAVSFLHNKRPRGRSFRWHSNSAPPLPSPLSQRHLVRLPPSPRCECYSYMEISPFLTTTVPALPLRELS